MNDNLIEEFEALFSPGFFDIMRCIDLSAHFF